MTEWTTNTIEKWWKGENDDKFGVENLKNDYVCYYPRPDRSFNFSITPNKKIMLSDGRELDKLCLL